MPRIPRLCTNRDSKKMTILSNHRNHTYKASAAYHRDISPKKIPFTPKKINESSFKPFTIKKSDPKPTVLKLVVDCVPTPSAPPAVMETRTIYVWDNEYKIQIPEGFDIYGGLRIWYPNLYSEVLKEEEKLQEEQLQEDEYEDMWTHHDYLEYMYD
jgi:hypothetical protein